MINLAPQSFFTEQTKQSYNENVFVGKTNIKTNMAKISIHLQYSFLNVKVYNNLSWQ